MNTETEMQQRSACGEGVELEWDGGVTFAFVADLLRSFNPCFIVEVS